MRSDRPSASVWLLVELLFWSAMALAFLGAYGAKGLSSPEVVRDHLSFFAGTVAGLFLLRLAAGRVVQGRGLRLLQAGLSVWFLAGWGLVYALVLVGLHHWGEVITLKILEVYAGQLGVLLETLGLAPVWLWTVGLSLLLLCLSGAYRLHRRPWAADLPRAWSRSRLAGFVLCLVLTVLTGAGTFWARWGLPTQEPLMRLFHERDFRSEQVLAFDGPTGARLRQQAVSARAAYVPSDKPIPAHVILIVVDALRDDHLGLNGYARSTTPHLQRWIERTRGVTLGQVRSVCASSLCGISGIMSSRFAHQQTPEGMTLHEVLKRHGWQVHLMLGGDHTNFYGLRERYGATDSYTDGSMGEPSQLNDDRFIVDTVARRAQDLDSPALLHLHLMSAHVLGRRFQPSGHFGPAANYSNPMLKWEADAVQRAVNYYDEGVLQADHIIDQLLQALQQSGRLDKALVVITGDHGEHLGEAGRFGHANGILEPAVRVPWVILPFGLELPPLKTDRRLNQVDIAPTLLDLLDMPLPEDWEGVSLLNPTTKPPFSHLLQGADIGLIDHRDPAGSLKYSVNAQTGVERLKRLQGPLTEDLLLDQQPERLKEWRSLVMPQRIGVTRLR